MWLARHEVHLYMRNLNLTEQASVFVVYSGIGAIGVPLNSDGRML